MGQHSAVQQLLCIRMYVYMYFMLHSATPQVLSMYRPSSEGGVKESPDSLVGRLHGVGGIGVGGGGVG